MHWAFARHERVHVAVPRCSGAAAWAGIVALLDVRESAISLNAIVSWSFCCLVAPASRAYDRDCRDARGERSVLSVRGVSQEGEGRDFRVITSCIFIVHGHRVAEPHAFLLHSWLAVSRRSPVVLSDHLLTARSNALAHW